VVASLIVQLVFARDVIPPLDAIAVAFVVGAVVARRRPRAGAITMGAAGMALTMRTLPSASVISSSETFDSDTRSISVFSLRRSMGSTSSCGSC